MSTYTEVTNFEKQSGFLAHSVYSTSPKNCPCGFLNFFPNGLEFLIEILRHAKLQNFIQLSPTLTNLCRIKHDHPGKFYISPEF